MDFQVVYLEIVKGFQNRLIGISNDVRNTPGDVIWTEIWGDAKRFNLISTYCDDGDTVSGDGCWRHWCYSILV